MKADALADSLEPPPEIVRILEEYMAEVENGRRPNIDEIVARYPELTGLSDHIRGCLASLEFLHPTDPRQSLELQTDSVADLPLPDPRLGQLGDFGLIREIGRGGMGIVYEAVQISLHRRVALKVLPFAAALDAKQLQRFKNEALAAAGLHHHHIVPIYAVGHERGVHYYAMQLIEGKSLADTIVELRGQKNVEHERHQIQDRESKTENRGLGVGISASTVEYHANGNETPQVDRPAGDHGSSPLAARSSLFNPPSSVLKSRSPFFRRVAQLGIEAAEALAHAHRLGIIHRDVKPANFMLDEEGKLWVTDFGLALVQHNMDLTATGDMLGTVRYMSPEQASSKRGLIDQRTDIYSLGATLYELLTLQPAFPEKDRNELLTKIATQEPPMPRRLNTAIPKDLETIVLKSMAKIPQERYLTAEDLAEDLRCFLDDRPIKATRPSLLERAIKWCRRHKAMVVGAGLLSIATSMLAAIMFFQHARQAEEKYQAKVQEEKRVLDNLRAAYEALNELCVKPTLERMPKNRDPQKQREDRELLAKAMTYYQRFADLNSSEPLAMHVAALACRVTGDISRELGDSAEGKDSYERAIHMLESLTVDYPREPEYRGQLAQCRSALGQLYWTNSQLDRAELILDQETRDLERAVKDFPNVPGFVNELASCRQNFCMLLLVTGQTQRAEDILRENQATVEELTKNNPCRPDFQKTLADNRGRLGWVLMETGRLADSEKSYAQARNILKELNKTEPKVTDYRAALANVLYNLGLVARGLGHLNDSKKSYEDSIVVSKALVSESPQIPDYELELATEQHQLGLTLYKLNRPEEAEAAYRESKERLERLVRDFPTKQNYQKELACCANNLGTFLESTRKAGQAEEAFAQSAALLETLAQRFPNVHEFQSDLASSRYNLARMLAQRHEMDKACDLLKAGIDHQILATLSNPQNPEYRASLWAQYQLFLGLLVSTKKTEQVQSVLQQAQEKCKDLPLILNNFAWLMVIGPKPPVGDAKQALEFAKLAVAKAPENGGLWNTLGVAQYRAGNWTDAVDALNQSRTLRKGGDSYDFFFLAMAHWQSGDKEQARDWYKKATAALPKNKNPELARVQEEAKKLVKDSPNPENKPVGISK
jgi:eukaryotic-like serine/threonine-protein kinase